MFNEIEIFSTLEKDALANKKLISNLWMLLIILKNDEIRF